jgi:hypothetical protein
VLKQCGKTSLLQQNHYVTTSKQISYNYYTDKQIYPYTYACSLLLVAVQQHFTTLTLPDEIL